MAVERGMGPLEFVKDLPAIRWAISWSLLARMPTGIISIALPLFVLSREMSPSFAAAVFAAYKIVQAATSPLWGRISDGVPMGMLLRVVCFSYGAVSIGLAVLPLGAVGLLVGAAILGSVTLPFTAVMRVFWNRVLCAEEHRQAANAFESSMSEGVLLVGRVVVAVTALWVPLWVIVLAQGVVATGAGVALSFTKLVRPAVPVGGACGRRGVDVFFGALWLYVSLLLISGSLGAFSFALIVLFADSDGGPTATALCVGLWGLGSFVGLAFLRLDVVARSGSHRGLYALLVAMAVFQAAVMIDDGVVVFVVSLLAGLPISAVITGAYDLLTEVVPEGSQGEYFAWATTMIFVGDAVGAAVCGVVADRIGFAAGPVLASACAVAAVVAIGWHRSRAEETV